MSTSAFAAMFGWRPRGTLVSSLEALRLTTLRSGVPKIAPASLSTGDVAVVFDLTEMSFMDWCGYRSILVARRSLQERGGSLTLCNLVGRPAYALDVFDRLGMAA